jgi:hypothetical protein
MKNRNHGLWMMLCCILPLLAIFLLPGFGVKGDFSTVIFVMAMFVCHFMMMGGHQHNEEDVDNKTGKENSEHKEHKEGGQHGCH